MSIWSCLETGDNTTYGTEVPGVGVVLAVPGAGMCFVPGARLRMLHEPMDGATHQITREDRKNPALTTGLTVEQIRAKQPELVDPQSLNYIVNDAEELEY